MTDAQLIDRIATVILIGTPVVSFIVMVVLFNVSEHSNKTNL